MVLFLQKNIVEVKKSFMVFAKLKSRYFILCIILHIFVDFVSKFEFCTFRSKIEDLGVNSIKSIMMKSSQHVHPTMMLVLGGGGGEKGENRSVEERRMEV